jgi:hypothetical protein
VKKLKRFVKRLIAILILAILFSAAVVEAMGFYDITHGGEYMTYILPGAILMLVLLIILVLLLRILS